MARVRSLPVAELRAECKAIEAAVLAHRLASADEITAHRPGSPANPDPGPRGWLRFYGQLQRWHAREEEQATAAVPDDVDAAITRAVTAQPETVRLSILDDAGQPRVVHCYPKSRRALLLLHARDLRYAKACQEFRLVQQHGTLADHALLERSAEAMSEQLQQLVWAVTTPGAWLPFDSWAEYATAPAWISLLTPVDVIAILLAHKRVNQEQLAYLGRLVNGLTPSEARPGPGLLGWGAFVVHVAEATGVPLDVVDRDRALTQEMARIWVRAKTEEAARDAAKAS